METHYWDEAQGRWIWTDEYTREFLERARREPEAVNVGDLRPALQLGTQELKE